MSGPQLAPRRRWPDRPSLARARARRLRWRGEGLVGGDAFLWCALVARSAAGSRKYNMDMAPTGRTRQELGEDLLFFAAVPSPLGEAKVQPRGTEDGPVGGPSSDRGTGEPGRVRLPTVLVRKLLGAVVNL